MDAQERVIKTINHEEPDRVPSFESSIDNLKICKHYGAKYVYQGTGKALKMAYYLFLGNEKRLTKFLTKLMTKEKTIKSALKKNVDLYTKIGIDLAITPIALFPVMYEKNGFVDDYARKFKIVKNPADNMDVNYYVGGYLNDFEEYEAFMEKYPLDPDAPIRENSFRAGKELEKETNGKLYIIPGMAGMMEATWEGFGLENFSRLLKRKKQIKKVFDDRGQFAVELTKRVIEWGETGGILIFDDYGYKQGLFMSPKNYREFVFPWLTKICDTAHKGGIKVILHCCGDNYLIFEDIINAGVDALHPIEPTTANPEYDIFKLNKKYGDKICFVGNVSPQDLYDKDPEYIKNYTKKLLKEVAPGGGFILSSGHSINPAIKLENFLAMYDILKQYGKYPIKIE